MEPVTTVRFYFLFLCLPFSFLFTSLWVTWRYLVMGHMFSHMIGHLTCHMMRAHDQSHDHGLFLLHTWYDSLPCVSSIFSLWLTLPNLWLPWELPCHWLILPHHTLQYDLTAYVYLPILSTPVVVYKSGILGTQSPRLDFTCNMVLVNWSPVRGELHPSSFPLETFFTKILCLRRCHSSSEALRVTLLQLLLRTQNQDP